MFEMSSDAPKKVAFVTYSVLPDGTEDDRLALQCLLDEGIDAQVIVWDAPGVDWPSFDGIMLRSCWDYHNRPEEFAQWVQCLAAVNARLWNPPDLVLWNMNKRYLSSLNAKGIRTAPTVWLDKGSRASLSNTIRKQGWVKAVVKPVISASADRTWLVSAQQVEEKQPDLDAMVKQTGVMVQQFVGEITERGEWSFVFFNKEYSHAVRKQPATGDFRVQEEFGGTLGKDTPSPEMLKQAGRIVASVEGPCLYARVDAVDTGEGLLLMELELIEPYLFLTQGRAARRFANAIMSTLRQD